MNHDIARMADDAAKAIDAESTVDQVCLAIQYRDALREGTRELCERVEEAVIEWIKANGDVTIGPKRYYVGTTKTTKCRNPTDTLRAVLDATCGDVDAVGELLAAGAWKPGACRSVLPPVVYDGLFETREVADLKTGVAKPPSLQVIDERFVR